MELARIVIRGDKIYIIKDYVSDVSSEFYLNDISPQQLKDFLHANVDEVADIIIKHKPHKNNEHDTRK